MRFVPVLLMLLLPLRALAATEEPAALCEWAAQTAAAEAGVPPDILGDPQRRAVSREEPGGVQAAGAIEGALTLSQEVREAHHHLGVQDDGVVGHRPPGLLLDGVDAAGFDEERRRAFRAERIGLVFQQFHLIPYLTAVENLMVAQYYHSIPDKKEAMEALARVGLEDRAGHLPSELSGGEQQRVCIARALINYPVLILADEPTGNLDEKNEKLVMNLFRELNEEGHTIITVTHSDHVGKAAKRIVIIEHGHMREGGEEEKA